MKLSTAGEARAKVETACQKLLANVIMKNFIYQTKEA